MVVGFNHNFSHKGAVYHIQTEDSGVKSASIVTLLYRGGTILASRKTSYADISRVDNLEQVVEGLMKEQHKGMLRSLKSGEFDEAIARFEKSPQAVSTESTPEQLTLKGVPAGPPAPISADQAAPPSVAAAPVTQAAAVSVPEKMPSPGEANLDDIILSYLMGEEQ